MTRPNQPCHYSLLGMGLKMVENWAKFVEGKTGKAISPRVLTLRYLSENGFYPRVFPVQTAPLYASLIFARSVWIFCILGPLNCIRIAKTGFPVDSMSPAVMFCALLHSKLSKFEQAPEENSVSVVSCISNYSSWSPLSLDTQTDSYFKKKRLTKRWATGNTSFGVK